MSTNSLLTIVNIKQICVIQVGLMARGLAKTPLLLVQFLAHAIYESVN